MIGRKLRAEIDALLHVGLAGGELAANGEVSAPRPSAARHADLELLGFGKGEECAAGGVEPGEKVGGNAVARGVEEPGVAAGGFDRARDLKLRG